MSLVPPSFLPFWMRPGYDSDMAPSRPWAALGLFLAASAVAALYAAIYSPSGEGNWGWYPRLVKPGWVPSASVTAQIAPLFYLIIAFCGWRIWRTGAFRSIPVTGIGFMVLLVLQAIWSTLFYGLQNPLLGMLDLVVSAILAAILLVAYRPLDTLAAALWSVYLAWLLFSLTINASIWWLNG